MNNNESTSNKIVLLLICPLCKKDIPLVSIYMIKDQIVLYFRCISLGLNREITIDEYLTLFNFNDNEKNYKCSIDSLNEFIIDEANDIRNKNTILEKQLINAQLQLQITCFDHQKKYEAFCIQCYKSICSQCISNSHQNHKKIDLIKSNESITNKLLIQKNQIKSFLTNISELQKNFNATLTDNGKINNITIITNQINKLFLNITKINNQLLCLWKLIYNTALLFIPDYPNYPLMILINKLQINITKPTTINFNEQYEDYLQLKAYLTNNYLIDFKQTQIKEYADLKYHSINTFTKRIRSVIQLTNTHLCFCSDDLTIQEWDLNTQTWLKTYNGHTDLVLCLCQLRDGRVVSGSLDHLIKIWELGKDDCLATITLKKGSIWCVIQLSNDDLVSGSYHHYITIIDINTFESKASFRCSNSIWDLRQFTNGLLYASVDSEDQGVIAVVNALTNQKVTQLIAHNDRIMQIIELIGFMQFATCSADGTVKIWDMLRHKCIKIMQGHPKGVYSIVQLNSLTIAFCSWGNTMMIWNIEDKECITTVNTSDQPSGVFKLNDGRIILIENTIWSIWNI